MSERYPPIYGNNEKYVVCVRVCNRDATQRFDKFQRNFALIQAI